MLFESPKDTNLRHEWKHWVTPSDKAQIIARLNILCKPDPHYGARSYKVRSLYFDNVYDKALLTWLNGLECQEKFRLRYYDYDDSYITLEKKSKFNQLCGKTAFRLTREETEQLLTGKTEWLLEKGEPLCSELYAKMHAQLLRPRIIVDYSRRAFVFPAGNTRITIDDNIRTGLSSLDFFNPQLPTVPAELSRPTILEVKYDAYLPDVVRQAIQLPSRSTTSFSKYATCRLTNH